MHFQIHYNIIVRTGSRTYPRYFKVEFAFNKAKYRVQPRPIDPAKMELQARVIKLRSQGWSFPAIAKHLDISVGTAWNITNANAVAYRDKLDRLE
jgi:DNA-binding NarL/FixJ family response regulator